MCVERDHGKGYSLEKYTTQSKAKPKDHKNQSSKHTTTLRIIRVCYTVTRLYDFCWSSSIGWIGWSVCVYAQPLHTGSANVHNWTIPTNESSGLPHKCESFCAANLIPYWPPTHMCFESEHVCVWLGVWWMSRRAMDTNYHLCRLVYACCTIPKNAI